MKMVSQPCKYAKTHFKWVNFMVYKLYFNKARYVNTKCHYDSGRMNENLF